MRFHKKDNKPEKRSLIGLISIYGFLVLWYTLLSRSIVIQEPQLGLLWSYKKWLSGDSTIGAQIIYNIVLFIPFGFLFPYFMKTYKALMLSLLLSFLIEVGQLISYRGLFEFDDIIDNTIGSVLGIIVFIAIQNYKIHLTAGVLSALALSIFCLFQPQFVDSSSRNYCFQVDSDLSGFFIRFNSAGDSKYNLLLKSTTTEEFIKLDTTTGITRPDVDKYFSCNLDFSLSGFQINSILQQEEYEFIIQLNPIVLLRTEVFISESQGVHFIPEKQNNPLKLKADFTKDGFLLVYNSDNHCWVYQYEGSLYWIADQDFYFEDDGSTYIQYQLWTTQPDKLPQRRIENGWDWDNIGGNFEDYEIHGDFGDYRVMKREIPTDYSITSIETGYYKEGKWRWREFFRPIYEFESDD